MLIVVGLVLAQDLPQMGLVPDEGAVQELASASPDPAFGDRVHAGRPHVAEHGPDAGVGEDRVEGGGTHSGQLARSGLRDVVVQSWLRSAQASDNPGADPPVTMTDGELGEFLCC